MIKENNNKTNNKFWFFKSLTRHNYGIFTINICHNTNKNDSNYFKYIEFVTREWRDRIEIKKGQWQTMKSLNNSFFVYEHSDQTYSSIIIGKIVANCCCNLTVLSCNLMNGFVAFLLNCGIVFYFVYNRKNYPSILKRQLFTLLNWCNILIVSCLRFYSIWRI